jgi:hypothetical protein
MPMPFRIEKIVKKTSTIKAASINNTDKSGILNLLMEFFFVYIKSPIIPRISIINEMKTIV